MTNQTKNDKLLSIAEALQALSEKYKYNRLEFMYPNTGPYRKELYAKHMEFMEAGARHLIRAFTGGNGTGKTMLGGTEFAYHLTGKYPKDWKGRVYNHAIKAWGCARENKQLREAMQEILFGSSSEVGTGLIPRDCLLNDKGEIQTLAMSGTGGCIGSARVKHYTRGNFDGWSEVHFKTYAQGWQEFQGSTRDLIWLDEEPDDVKIYAECIARTRGPKGKEGSLFFTFTPLLGYSKVYLSFFPNGQRSYNGINPENPEKFVSQLVTIDDVPHLSDRIKESMIQEWKLSDPNSLDARTKGIASVGSGLVYPIDESFVVVPKQRIPNYWKKCYGMDPGYANFAIVWIAEDPNTGIKYIYDEYKHGKVVYLLHAEAVKNRGEWIAGGIDPHEAVKPRDTGETVQGYFESLGLELLAAKGDADALRARIRAMLDAGSLKIMDNCLGILSEIRTYRYDIDDPNKIAKNQEDHRLDAMMYNLCVFDSLAKSYSEIEDEIYNERHKSKDDDFDSERNNITGY